MIWKTSLVAIGLKSMGHVVRLFRVGAIPNGDPSSRVPYIVILCNYMKTLQEKTSPGCPGLWCTYPWLHLRRQRLAGSELKWTARIWNLPFLWPSGCSTDSANKNCSKCEIHDSYRMILPRFSWRSYFSSFTDDLGTSPFYFGPTADEMPLVCWNKVTLSQKRE